MTGPTRAALRVGIVGCGRIAQVAHLPASRKADGVELVAVCDASRFLSTAVGRQYDVPAFTELDRFLAAGLDAVIVATPDRLHLPHAVSALEAGKHVLIEKPLASNTGDARRLGELAEALGLKLQVGSMKRHDPGIEFARSAMPRIGAVLSLSCWYRVMAALRPPTEATLFPRLVVDPEVRGREAVYKADRERYLLATHGVHVFDSLRYLAGDLADVSVRRSQIGSDFCWHGRGMLVRSGGIATFEIAANVHADWSEGFDVYGELGRIAVRSWFPFYRRASSVRLFLEESCEEIAPQFADADPYERQLEAFARSVEHDTAPNPGAADGVAAVEMVEASAESARRDGEVVALNAVAL
jgi:predicted dehydrogenase